MQILKTFSYGLDAQSNPGWIAHHVDNAFAVTGDVVAHDVLEHCTNDSSVYGELHAFGAYAVVRGFASEGPECLYYDLATLVQDIVLGHAQLEEPVSIPPVSLTLQKLYPVEFDWIEQISNEFSHQLSNALRTARRTKEPVIWNYEELTPAQSAHLVRAHKLLSARTLTAHLGFGLSCAHTLYGHLSAERLKSLFNQVASQADRRLEEVKRLGLGQGQLCLKVCLKQASVQSHLSF